MECLEEARKSHSGHSTLVEIQAVYLPNTNRCITAVLTCLNMHNQDGAYSYA
jgi:hypothetical protein